MLLSFGYFDDRSPNSKRIFGGNRRPLASLLFSSSSNIAPSLLIDRILSKRYRGVEFEFFPGEPTREVLLAMKVREEGESWTARKRRLFEVALVLLIEVLVVQSEKEGYV